jgi:hypothetical protein
VTAAGNSAPRRRSRSARWLTRRSNPRYAAILWRAALWCLRWLGAWIYFLVTGRANADLDIGISAVGAKAPSKQPQTSRNEAQDTVDVAPLHPEPKEVYPEPKEVSREVNLSTTPNIGADAAKTDPIDPSNILAGHISVIFDRMNARVDNLVADFRNREQSNH